MNSDSPSAGDPAVPACGPSAAARSLVAPRLLIVDDDPVVLASTERELAARYDVTALGRPADALERAADVCPDLAIIDVHMVDMNGFEVARRLRKVVPGVDVIFMTSAVQELDAELIRSIREKAFFFIRKPFDPDVLLAIVARCLEVRRLNAENRLHTQRLEADLQEARAFQQGLMPSTSDRHQRVSVAARYVPCDAMGGDFYDWADAGRGGVAMMQADVSGHGVSAAMMTGIIKAAFRATRVDQFEPISVIERIANAIRPFDESRFVTLFAARVYRDNRLLEYACAGHPSAILRRADRSLEELPLTGPLVTPAYPDMEWGREQVAIHPGDLLVVTTDGIVEARNGDEQFGRERLRRVVAEGPDDGGEVLDEILSQVDAWRGGQPADDDETLLAASLD